MDRDVQMLANRIALLKQEEAKTRKRIEETKKKSKEIVKRKQLADQRNAKKQSMKNRGEDELDNIRRQNFEMSKQRQDEHRRVNNEIIYDRHADANSIRQESKKNDMKKREIIEAYEAKNQEKKIAIRMEEEMRQKKLREMKEKRLKEFKQDYDERVKEEMDKIKNKEKNLLVMEKEEAELIKKLQNTQHMQKEAFNELEIAIKTQGSGKSSPKSPNKSGSPSSEANPPPFQSKASSDPELKEKKETSEIQ